MRRIRQPAVRERVSHQQVTEFVVNTRNWNGNPRQERQPEDNYKKKQEPDCERFSFRQICEGSFEAAEKFLAGTRCEEAERDKSEDDDDNDKNFSGELQHRAAARRIHFKEYFWIPDLNGVSGRLQHNRFPRLNLRFS